MVLYFSWELLPDILELPLTESPYRKKIFKRKRGSSISKSYFLCYACKIYKAINGERHINSWSRFSVRCGVDMSGSLTFEMWLNCQ